jgi:hypothetical protein
VCCQVKVSASEWASLTEFGVSECDREACILKRPWPTVRYGAIKENVRTENIHFREHID